MATKTEKADYAARLKAVEQATAAKRNERHTAARPAGPGLPTGTPAQPGQAPRYRAGESALTSRGFSFGRLIGAITGRLGTEHAKVEMQQHDHMTKAMIGCNIWPMSGAFVAPFSTAHIPENMLDFRWQADMRSMVKAGVAGADPDEMRWLAQKSYSAPGQKAVTGGQSWLDAQAGGALVGPPEFGELIDLWRNKAAMTTAGATIVPLPPTGRIQFPRQTGASTGYWVGENTDITQTTVATGTLTLSAKKVGGLVVFPNELLRFASVAAEALIRKDLTATLGLTADLAFIDGEGGDLKPLGILNTPGIAAVTPTTVAADGNTLSPQDLFSFIAQTELNNADFEAWVLRPDLFWKFVQARAGVYNGSAVVAQGQFVYDQMRALAEGFQKTLAGFKAITTPNVPKNRVKGSGTTLTAVIGGKFSDFLIGVFGVMEFVSTNEGIQLLKGDQTAIRAIMTTDGGARHPGGFSVSDSLLTAVGV